MVNVILAGEEHLEAISGLEKLCFEHSISPAVLFENICVSNYPHFVIKLDEDIIGYGGMYIVIDEAYIINICVHPDYRGRGYGKQLLTAMISEAKRLGAQRMTLEVRASNAVAIELYKDMGFNIEAVRPKYYVNEDAYIMWKQDMEIKV